MLDAEELERMLKIINNQLRESDATIRSAIKSGDSKLILRRMREEILLRSMAQNIRELLLKKELKK